MFKGIGILSSVLLIAALAGGYFVLRRTQTQHFQSSVRQAPAPAIEPAKLQVYEDEVFLKKSEAVIGGTIENISNESLGRLQVTIKLQRRDGREELKTVPLLGVKDLAPGARGNYSLRIPTGLWDNAKVVSVAPPDTNNTYSFKSKPGKERPAEPPPATIQRTVIIERTKPRPKGEEFINTPDNPVIIR
jgi:hypothetical protein